MNMQIARTIVITTLTAMSVFILASPFVSGYLCSEGVTFFIMDILVWASFAVFPFAILTFAAMWGWRFPPELKMILVMFHLILAALAGFCVWFFWFAEFPGMVA